jgi:hypothetical protein
MNGLRGSKMVAQALSMGKELDANPCPLLMANVERVCGVILQNRRVTVDEVAHQLQIIFGAAYEIIHNRLVFHKVCA